MAASNGGVIVYKDNSDSDGNNTGKSQAYQGPTTVPNLHQINWPGTSNNESTDISALSIGTNAWFLAINKHGVGLLFEPNQEVDSMPSGWNNAITNFVIFNSDPSANLTAQNNITYTTYTPPS